MLAPLALLLACQLAGETVSRALALPIPGPVLGLVLLAALLAIRRVNPGELDSTALGRTAAGLLGVLGILFVPAGVGVIQQFGLLREHGLALGLALIGSTILTMLVTVATFLAVARWVGK